MRAILTTIGADKAGIIAGVSTYLAKTKSIFLMYLKLL